MQCPACGKPNAERGKFCMECGSSLDATAEVIQPHEAVRAAKSGTSSANFAGKSRGDGSSCDDDLKAGATQAPWLESAYASSSPGRPGVAVTIPAGLEKYRGANLAGTLVFARRHQFRRVHLFGSRTLKFGRVPEQNDVTLFVLPLTPQNQALTKAVSSQHFKILLDRNGLVVQDRSKYGTSLNGRKLQGSGAVPLDQVSEVAVGVSLKLRLTPLVKQPPGEGWEHDPYAGLAPADESWTTAAGLGLGGLLVERVDNAAEEECYLMVFTWAALGPAFDGDTGLPPVEGGRLRLVRRAGQFWLHNVASAAPPSVEGVPVPGVAISPLLPGMKLTLDGGVHGHRPVWHRRCLRVCRLIL
ncbi:MAG: FHA domain-containing protein [Planctomycetota bacterium]|nr:FHA domain-containing protein [Planctomycetota bacterium]